MNRYRYQATNADGRMVSAEIDANGVSEALLQLESQGLVIVSIEVVSPEKIATDRELAIFYSEVERLLERRSDWLPPIQSLVAELPRGMARRRLEKQVKAVSRIATAQEFTEHPDAIALLPLIVPRFQSDRGFHSSPDWLIRAAQALETRSRYFQAFVYPSVLLSTAILAFVLLSIYVVPLFSSLLEDQLRVPKSTSVLLWTSEQLTRHTVRSILYVLFSGLFFVGLFRWWRKHALTNRLFGRLVAGRTSNLLAMSTLTATLAELLELKSPLGLALSIAGRCCKHAYYRHATECLAKSTHLGSLSDIPSPAKICLPPLLLHALQASDNGRPDLPLLHALASLYGDRARTRSDWMVAGGPNLAIFFVGVFILWIVVGLFSALAHMITVLSQ